MMYVLLKQGRLYYVKSIIQPVFYIQKYEEIYPSAEKRILESDGMFKVQRY